MADVPVLADGVRVRGRGRRSGGKLAAAELRRQILDLAVAGASDREVGAALGITTARVKTIIGGQLKRWENDDRRDVNAYRNLQLARIDRLVAALWDRAIGDPTADPPVEPSVPDIAEIRKLEALRARLTGTEAPKKIDVSGDIGIDVSHTEIDRLERAWAAGLEDDVVPAELRAPELPVADIVDAEIVEP